MSDFMHSARIWADFPALVPCIMRVGGVTPDANVTAQMSALQAVAAARLELSREGEFPEVQAWRRAFTQMGFKATQYRCASESLLRRYRKEGSLPRLHPLVDLCNAASIAFAIPVAVLDADRIQGDLQVRHATGDEQYQCFSGEIEHPEPGEVVFADGSGQAHARRWTHRQSRTSAVSHGTTTAVIIIEALHDSALADTRKLQAALIDSLAVTWRTSPVSTILSRENPTFRYSQSGIHRL